VRADPGVTIASRPRGATDVTHMSSLRDRPTVICSEMHTGSVLGRVRIPATGQREDDRGSRREHSHSVARNVQSGMPRAHRGTDCSLRDR
jgi:hypothetical protein